MKFSYCNSFNLAINLPMLDEKTKHRYVPLGVSKKTEKPSKPNKPRKKNRKNRTKKNRLNRFFFQKIFGSVRFRFSKPETGKTPTEPNRFDLRGTINRKKNTF
jgi:hypothetical protein